MSYGQQSSANPFMQGFTSHTDMDPFIQASMQAQQQLLGANQQANQYAQQGIAGASGQIGAGLNQANQYTQPYTQGGGQAFNTALTLAGGGNGQSLDSLVQNNAVLNAINQAGQRSMATIAANQGLSGSGAYLQDVNKLAQNNTAQYIAQLQGENANLAQIGVNPTLNTSNNAMQAGAAQAQLTNNAGQTNANAALAAGNINANNAMNIGNAQVAQSTVRGIGAGQMLGQGVNSGAPQVQQQTPFAFPSTGYTNPQNPTSPAYSAPYTPVPGLGGLNNLMGASSAGGGGGTGSSGTGGVTSSGGAGFNFGQIAQSVGQTAASSPFGGLNSSASTPSSGSQFTSGYSNPSNTTSAPNGGFAADFSPSLNGGNQMPAGWSPSSAMGPSINAAAGTYAAGNNQQQYQQILQQYGVNSTQMRDFQAQLAKQRLGNQYTQNGVNAAFDAASPYVANPYASMGYGL